MDNIEFVEKLRKYKACDEAVEWVADQSLEEIWETCVRGDWLMWLVIFFHMDKKSNTIHLYADFIKTILNYSIQPIEVLLENINIIENKIIDATHEELDQCMIDLYEIYTTALSTILEEDKEAMYSNVANFVKQRVPVPSYSAETIYE